MKHTASQKGLNKRKFVSDTVFKEYTQPKMLDAAQEVLCLEEISEEAFLGAQGILLLNGIL